MSEILKFHPLTADIETLVPPPKPARIYIPDWYRDIPTIRGDKKVYEDGDLQNHSIKMCMPFLDTFLTGYIQETWCDIHIEMLDDGTIKYNYAMQPEIMTIRGSQVHIPEEFIQREFAWRQPWAVESPKGWSCLMIHPLNHYELPFQTLTGIIDSDHYYREPFPNNFPFFMKRNFQGIIPAGTPMFQIIPFKREEWTHQVEEYNDKANKRGIADVRRFFQNGYKNLHWQRKMFT